MRAGKKEANVLLEFRPSLLCKDLASFPTCAVDLTELSAAAVAKFADARMINKSNEQQQRQMFEACRKPDFPQ